MEQVALTAVAVNVSLIFFIFSGH